MASKLSTYTVTCGLLLLLAGCGGSGGGSSGSAPDPELSGEPVTYSGSRAPAVIREDTAIDLASTLLTTLNAVELASSFWTDIPGDAATGSSTVAGSGGGSLTSKLTINGIRANLQIQFNNFVEEGVTYNGYLEQTMQALPNSSGYSFSSDGDVDIKLISISEPGMSVSLSGIHRKSNGTSTSNVVVKDNFSGASFQLENFQITSTQSLVRIQNSSTYEMQSTLSGNVYDSDKGLMRISTTRPILDFAYDDVAGTWRGKGNGTIQIVGDGATLQLTALNHRHASLMLDENNDAGFERALRVTWQMLSGDEEFSRSANTRFPVANTGEAVDAFVDGATRLSGLFSHDADGDFLTFNWTLEHKPLTSHVELVDANLPTITFIPDAAGDYIFSLQVSDGTNTSKSSMKITAGPSIPLYFSETSAGALEVTLSPTNPRLFQFDTKSASTLTGVDADTAGWFLELPSSYLTRVESSTVLRDSFSAVTAHINDLDLRDSAGGLFRLRYTSGHSGFLDINTGGGEFDLSSELDIATEPSDTGVAGAKLLDINGNGAGDLLVWKYDPADTTNYRAVILNILHGTPNGTYTLSQSFSFGEGNVSTGDLNSDGRPDLASSSTTGMYVAYQNTSGTFDPPVFLPFGSEYCNDNYRFYVNSVFNAITDFNADGRQDLVAELCGKAVVWEQASTGNLLSLSANYTGINISAFSDLNRDGRTDVIGASRSVAAGAIAYNTSSGFDEHTIQGTNVIVATTDLSNDSRPDLLAYASPGGYTILTQTTEGDFEQTGSINTSVSSSRTDATHFAFGDINNDGLNDIVERGTYKFNTHVNLGNGEFFSAILALDSSYVAMPLEIVDIDGDDHQDILCINAYGYGALRVYWGGLRVFSTPVNP